MEKFKFIYDGEADSLLVYREDRQSHASIELGGIIVDLDRNYSISAVEVLNPDIMFNIPKKMFLGISSASIQIRQWGHMCLVLVALKFGNAQQAQLPIPLALEQPISI